MADSGDGGVAAAGGGAAGGAAAGSGGGSEERRDIKRDVSKTAAFRFLTELGEAGKLTSSVVDLYKQKYAQLHDYVLATMERERELLKRAKMLHRENLGEVIKMEKLEIRKAEEAQVLQNLEEERKKAAKEEAECDDREAVLQYEIQELQRAQAELLRQKEEMEKENEARVEPEIRRAHEKITELKEEIAAKDKAYEALRARKEEYVERLGELSEQQEALEEGKVRLRHGLSKLKSEPERLKKQADLVLKATENLRAEVSRLDERIHECDVSVAHQAKKRKEGEAVHSDLARKLTLHRQTIETRERDVGSVKKSLDMALERHADGLARRVELELKTKGEEGTLKAEVETLALRSKEFEATKRKLKKKAAALAAAKAALPQFEFQLTDARHQLESYRNENKRLRATLAELKQEVDIFIANYLRQEGVEKGRKDELEALMAQIAELEAELSEWAAEEHKQNKLIALLSSQREIKAREASKAMSAEKETKQDVKVKSLIIFDLTKKCAETSSRLTEFSALYDIVKNERNKYVNYIQASSQALAEMKEKIKILQNEVEILRNENQAKDKALAKERLAHQIAQNQRDSLRLDTNKCQATYALKQEQVEQQIIEMDKLNSIINGMERDMLQLKKKYELAVEARNLVGIQLIDRNDELCILYEKSNIQEQTLKRGEVEIRAREEELRMRRLEFKELQRQVEVTRKLMPRMPEYAERILALQTELAEQRELTEKLCRDLETPKNKARWHALGGEDPDAEQLAAKLAVLEERLNDKKEQLLEKELVLEEITNLSDKLRHQAAAGRNETVKLAKRVNDFQARIKELTRKMMATVSELSMYQATAMKLQQERHDKELQLEDARWRLEHGEPPTEAAERDWYRLERERVRRHEMAMTRRRGGDGPAPLAAVRTTADPRPNAYIPDDLGIPRPYGALAPFKPTVTGSSMRHIRRPRPREIEI